MWKPEHRIAADRSGLRYPSDLTSAEWAIVEPMVPPAKHGGRKRTIDVREILNGIFYVLWTGCQWQALPKDLPPKSTVWAYFDLWTWDGTLERIHHALYVAVREQAGREASPTTAIIDSQSAKGAQKGGPCSTHRASMRARRLRRRRLSRAEGREGCGQEWLLDNRDRRTLAHRRRIRSPTQALDRRTHLCLAQPFTATGTRFRALRQNRRRLHPPRHDPHHAQAPRCKLLVMNRNFADGLLDQA